MYLISFSMPSDLRCRVEYQWFLIELSVLLSTHKKIVSHYLATQPLNWIGSTANAPSPGASPSELAIDHAPAREKLGDLSPAVAKATLRQTNAAVLIRRPRILSDGGVELVFEALPTLLATTALELSRDNGPLTQPVLLYKRNNQVVLLL
jgi:hypothetical protein